MYLVHIDQDLTGNKIDNKLIDNKSMNDSWNLSIECKETIGICESLNE